jgi:hypothetical protein
VAQATKPVEREKATGLYFYSQVHSRSLSKRLAATFQLVNRRRIAWDTWIGGCLFLAGYSILVSRFGSEPIIRVGKIYSNSSRTDVETIEHLKVACSDLYAYAHVLLQACSVTDIQVLQEALAGLSRQSAGLGDDFLSWLYQDLKQERSDSTFKSVLGGKKKLAQHDLLVTTQFFTDRYMVEFLVRESLSLLNLTHRTPADIAVVDPACGGGNFLLTAFDILWQEFVINRKYGASKIARQLLNNVLVGYDLDPLLAGLCRLNLTLKANNFTGQVLAVGNNVFGGSYYRYGFLDRWDQSNVASPQPWQQFRDLLKSHATRKAIVTNPPFAGPRDLHSEVRDFIKQEQPQSKGDLCVAFMVQVLKTLKVGDVAGFVTQRSWMYLSTFREFREHMLKKYALEVCVDLGAKAFRNIGGEKSSVALPIFTCEPIPNHKCKFYRVLDPSSDAKQAVLSDREILQRRLFVVPQNHFLSGNENNLSYFARESVSQAYASLQKYADYALPMQGTSTGDHKNFIDAVWLHAHDPDWRLVSKGGGYCRWVGLNHYAIRWGKNGEYIRDHPGSAMRNVERMPYTDLVYSDTGTNGLSVRILKPGQIFVASGPGIQVLGGDKFSHLAFLNSRIATFLLRQLTPKLTVSAGYLARLPIPDGLFVDKKLRNYAKHCVELKTKTFSRKVKTPEYLVCQHKRAASLESKILYEIALDVEEECERLKCEAVIEVMLASAFHFSKSDKELIQSEVGQCAYTRPAELLPLSLDNLDQDWSARLTPGIEYNSGRSARSHIGCDGPLEDLALLYCVQPHTLSKLILRNLRDFYLVKRIYFRDALHKEVLNLLGFKSILAWIPTEHRVEEVVKKIRHRYKDVDNLCRALFDRASLDDWMTLELPAIHNEVFLGKPFLGLKGKNIETKRL